MTDKLKVGDTIYLVAPLHRAGKPALDAYPITKVGVKYAYLQHGSRFSLDTMRMDDGWGRQVYRSKQEYFDGVARSRAENALREVLRYGHLGASVTLDDIKQAAQLLGKPIQIDTSDLV